LSGLSGIPLDIDTIEAQQPGGPILRRARVRLDLAASLWHREWYAQSGGTYRYVACDASPQARQSLEIFVAVERVIVRSALNGGERHALGEAFATRLFPLVTLGHGRTSLEDKVAAHLHQLTLDYGPSIARVEAACGDVRQVLSGMGVELGMANFGNVIGQVLVEERRWPGVEFPWVPSEFGHLFPFALQVPGLIHILDWIVRETVQTFPWWAAWQSDAKRILQFCHGQAHRERLQAILEEQGPADEQASWTQRLVTGTGRFAEWRWKTLSRALSDLASVEPCLRWLASNVGPWENKLAARDTVGIRQLQDICARPETWERAKALQSVTRPLMSLMGWVQGCDCHESELLAGKAISCPFKGCRAPGLSARLNEARAELDALRRNARLETWGAALSAEVVCAVTHTLACVDLKFLWVDDLPYLVWQVVTVRHQEIVDWDGATP